MGKRTKKILEWIEAYSKLVDLDIKYFELSVSTLDKSKRKTFRGISDQYNNAVFKLIDKLP